MTKVCSKKNLSAFEELNYELQKNCYRLHILLNAEDDCKCEGKENELNALLWECKNSLEEVASKYAMLESCLREQRNYTEAL